MTDEIKIADFDASQHDIVIVRNVEQDKPLMRCDPENVWWITIGEDEINLRELIDTLTATLTVLDELSENARAQRIDEGAKVERTRDESSESC